MMRKYDDEFKQQAVKKILDGQSVASVSRELGVAESLLHTGVAKRRRLRLLRMPRVRLLSYENGCGRSRWSVTS